MGFYNTNFRKEEKPYSNRGVLEHPLRGSKLYKQPRAWNYNKIISKAC